MIVVITREAEVDLEGIGDFIARDNPHRAVSFVDDIIEACERLADAPFGYPLVARYEKSGIRRRTFGTYLIFYRVAPKQIEVLHIMSGARDYEAILLAERS